MKYAEINKRFTEKVAEYLSMGYIINTRTMSGTQGEIASIDLTNGTEIVRIVLERNHRNFKDVVTLTVGKAKNNVRPNSPDDMGTIWNGRLETIEQYTWYRHDFRKDWYVTVGEEDVICEIHRERISNAQYYHLQVFGDVAKKVVLSFIRRQPKHKSIKLSDRESVYKTTTTNFEGKWKNRYEVRVKGKRFVLA